jgi:hypothetical protein
MKKEFFVVIFCMVMLIVATGTFAQEATIIPWGHGLETGFGLTEGYENDYSISFQGWHRYGSGWSIDWISRHHEEKDGNHSYVGFKGGLLGSLFLGFPIGDIFRPYVGGGIGIGFVGFLGNNFFAWKLGAGLQAWFFDSFYITTGYTYDNIREHSISVGVGFKLKKEVTSTYRNADGSTFRRTWTRFLWESNSTPDRIYADKFSHSEFVRRYQKTTSSTVREMGRVQSRVALKGGGYSGHDGDPGILRTYFYVYDVTVTRNWYTRTWYYKDRAPTTENIYEDVEAAVLVDTYTTVTQ